MSPDTKDIKKVLVLMPDKHMGNLVVSLPAINALREFYNDKSFCLVVDSAYSEIVETLEGIDQLLLYPRQHLQTSSFLKRPAIFLKFLQKLRSISPDIAIDLEGREVSSTMTFLSGSSLRVGSYTSRRAYSYNMKVNLPKGRHKVYHYLEIASAVGAHSKSEVYRLHSCDTRRASLRSILYNKKITIDKPIVCVHPCAGKVYKQWNLNGFADISDWLISRHYQVVFIGSNIEFGNIRQITSRLKGSTFNLAGKLSLGELMALLEISSLYIGNDSGPMHIADAIGIPVIALFGPADEKRWGPLSEKSIVLRGTEPCEKCKGKDCQYEFRCIKTITPDNVKAAIERLINTTSENK